MLLRTILLAFLFSVTVQASIWDADPLADYVTKRFHKGQFSSMIDQKVRDFVVLLPEGYDPEQETEIIYFLNGGRGDAYGMAVSLDTQATQLAKPFYANKVFVALSMNNYGMWSNNATEQSTDILLEFIGYFESHVKHSSVRNLIGHSLGGSGAFHLAFEHSSYFDRIASVSAAILKWNPVTATPEMIKDYIRDHAPNIPFDYFAGIVGAMKREFVTVEAYEAFDFYNRIQSKPLPECFGFFMGSQDPMGFAYLAHEFLKYVEELGKKIYYVENPDRTHEVGTSLTEIAEFFEGCEI